MNEPIPFYVPDIGPTVRICAREGDWHGAYYMTVMMPDAKLVNMVLSPERLAQLAFDVHRITLVQGAAFVEQAKRGAAATASSG